MTQGEVGQYKVAWMDSGKLNSKMFDVLDDAKSFSDKTPDSLVMQSVSANNGTYSWELLKYGKSYWKFKASQFVSNHDFLFGTVSFIILALAAYGVIHYFSRK